MTNDTTNARRFTTDSVAKWLTTRPTRVAVALALTVIASLAIVPTMRVESGTSIFIPDGDPARQLQQRIERQFIGEDLVFIGLEQDDAFSAASLSAQRALDERLKALTMPMADGGALGLVDDVLSLTTVQTVDGADQFYRSAPLVPDVIPSDAAGLAAIRARAAANPLIRDGLLSPTDPRVSGVLVRLTKGLGDDGYASVTNPLRALVHEGETVDGRTAFIAGDPIVTVDTAVYQEADLVRFIPITYLLLAVAMALYLRRWRGVVLALVNATVALLVGMATVACTASLTNLTTIMPPLLMVLSIATLVHFTSELSHHAKHDPATAARRTFQDLLVPTFMCEATTAVGFVSFVTSEIPALRGFGVAASIAVMAAMAASFLVLGLASQRLSAAALIDPTPGALSRVIDAIVRRVSALAIARPWTMLLGTLAISAFFAVGMSRLTVNHDDIEQFSEATPLQKATRFMQERLGGSGELVVSVKAKPGQFLEPRELEKLSALQAFLTSDFGATSTASFADLVKLMNRGFNGDDATAYRLPASREQVAQLVFLNGDDRLFTYVDRDHGWVRLEARTKETGSAELSRKFARLERYLALHFPRSAGYETATTGTTYLSIVLGDRIVDSQTSSFGLSLLLIFLPIALMFGSFVAGAFTIPSNVFPILACLGFMGWAGVPLDISTTMIASIILGIAVDDTIHFVQNIRRLLGQGFDHERAVHETLVTKGASAVWITLIIGLGFTALVFSRFKPTASFGLLTAFGMATGAVAELFLLPPLIVLTKTRLGVPGPKVLASEGPRAMHAPRDRLG